MDKQILIVEDEKDCAELLRYHLQKENYQTVVARNGEEAIDAVQCYRLDAVLLDVMLPELSGWEVCRLLRESSKGKCLPIIMLTALSDEESRVKGLSLGADDYLSKPYSMKELLLKVRKHLDRQDAVRQFSARAQEQDTALQYMIHEMRNAMTVIGGYSGVALKKEDPRRYLKPIHVAAVHAESLLNDASLLSKLEKGGSSLPMETMDIVDLVKDVADTFHDGANKKRREIVIMNFRPCQVRVNRTAARQVLVNLLSNAGKYSPECGRIWVYFDEHPYSVDVSIKDEGCGIRQEELPRIFEKYYRAAGSEQVKGAGLGLFIVHLLAESMGGKITVMSDQGAGSTFTVSFVKAEEMALDSGRRGSVKAEQW